MRMAKGFAFFGAFFVVGETLSFCQKKGVPTQHFLKKGDEEVIYCIEWSE